jgi:hypothetical protein
MNVCPMAPEAAERCMWDLAREAVGMAEFAMGLFLLMILGSFLLLLFLMTLTHPRI